MGSTTQKYEKDETNVTHPSTERRNLKEIDNSEDKTIVTQLEKHFSNKMETFDIDDKSSSNSDEIICLEEEEKVTNGINGINFEETSISPLGIKEELKETVSMEHEDTFDMNSLISFDLKQSVFTRNCKQTQSIIEKVTTSIKEKKSLDQVDETNEKGQVILENVNSMNNTVQRESLLLKRECRESLQDENYSFEVVDLNTHATGAESLLSSTENLLIIDGNNMKRSSTYMENVDDSIKVKDENIEVNLLNKDDISFSISNGWMIEDVEAIKSHYIERIPTLEDTVGRREKVFPKKKKKKKKK